MNNYSTIFRQILNLLPQKKFQYEAEKHNYNRYTKHFTVWNQFFVLLYAQATGKKSLRDIETSLRVHHTQWYHLGLKNVSKSQLANSNKKRSYHIFKNLYYHLFSKFQALGPKRKFKFKGPLQILDSTLISLCLSIFPWAKYHKKKGALKIHTLLDDRGTIPSFLAITDGKQSDIKIAKESKLPLSRGSIIVMDKAYIDYGWLNELNDDGVFFVTRAKNNMEYDIVGQHKEIKNKKITDDFKIALLGSTAARKYPNHLRMVFFYDEETGQDLTDLPYK